MRTFKDGMAREWAVTINCETLHRIKQATGLNLAKLFDDDMRIGKDLADDPVSLAAVLYSLIEPTAQAQAVSIAAFRESLCGDAIEGAYDALVWGVVDFFPTPRRTLLTEALTRGEAEVKRIEAAALSTLTSARLSLPDSAGSNPGGLPLANCS